MHIVFLLNKVETSNMLVCSLLKPFKYQECGMKEMALKKILQDLMIQKFSCFSDSNLSLCEFCFFFIFCNNMDIMLRCEYS